MSELKHQLMLNKDRSWVPCYLKSEADKVIAELEEKLKNSRNSHKYWRKEFLIEYEECCYQKYKRCLAMAKWCLSKCSFLCPKCDFYCRWERRWRKLAEKFKPNNEVNNG